MKDPVSLGTRLDWARTLGQEIVGELASDCRERLSTVPADQVVPWLQKADCPVWFLQQAAAHPDWVVRMAVAAHPKCPVQALGRLRNDDSLEVRSTAALHPCQSVGLAEMAQDEKWEVRHHLAWNRATPPALLESLAGDSNRHVRGAVGQAIWAPPALLDRLGQDPARQVRKDVASNPSTPVGRLRTLAQDSDYRVREAVAYNRRAPRALLLELARDNDAYVNCSAQETLQHREDTFPGLKGEDLWWELVDRYGKPKRVSRDEQGGDPTLWSVNVSDGYGSGGVAFFLQRPVWDGDHLRQIAGFCFGVPIDPSWPERLNENSWDRWGDLPGVQ